MKSSNRDFPQEIIRAMLMIKRQNEKRRQIRTFPNDSIQVAQKYVAAAWLINDGMSVADEIKEL